jgi:hypothetical protein
MTYFLLILSLFVWPFGQLLTFSLPSGVTLYLLDIILGLLSLSLLIFPKTRHQVFSDQLFKPLLIFLSIAFLSLLLTVSQVPHDLLFPIFYLARLFVYPAIYFAVKLYPRAAIIKPVIFSFVLFCLLGLGQYLFLPDMRFLKLVGFDDHYYRLIGSFYDPNFTGAILAGAALILIAMGRFIPGFLVVGLLALTFSRASFVCFVIGLLYLLIKKRQKKLLLFLLLLTVFIILIPKPFGEGVNLGRTFSIFSRFESWKSGLHLFFLKPILGWGYNTLRSINGDRFQIDNSYLYVIATTGIIGLSSFLYLLRRSWVLISSLPGKLFILTILLHSFFNNSLFYIWIFFAYFLVLGLSTKEYKKE